MRGYFGIGIDGASKEGNLGNLVRTAHSFGASFCFTVNAKMNHLTGRTVAQDYADTSRTLDQIPFYQYDTASDVSVPGACQLVGIEISDDAVDLPSFRHPTKAVYILGGERSSLSADMIERCDHLIKIPTKFSLNVATAGAIVLYDRWRLLGGFAERPLMAGQKITPNPPHVHGGTISRWDRRRKKDVTAADRARAVMKREQDGG